MKSSELFALSNLDGWRIGEGYFVGIEGDLGTFPALVSKTEKSFVCLEKRDVEAAISLLPKRPHVVVGTLLLLISEQKNIAFVLADVQRKWHITLRSKGCFPKRKDWTYDSESIIVLAEKDLESMKPGDLEWKFSRIMPGLSETVFIKTAKVAIKHER